MMSFRRAFPVLVVAFGSLFLGGCPFWVLTGPPAGSSGTSASYNVNVTAGAAATNSAAFVYVDVPQGWDLVSATYDATVDGVDYTDVVAEQLAPTEGPCGGEPPPAAGYQRVVFASQVFPETTVDDVGDLTFEFAFNGGAGNFVVTAMPGATGLCGSAEEDKQSIPIQIFGDPLAPTPTISFSPATIAIGETSTLTIELRNLNDDALSAVAFTNTYPAGLVNAATPNAMTTCAGGTVTGAAGSNSVGLSGATMTGQSACTVTIDVTAADEGSYDNTMAAGAVSIDGFSRESNASNTATLEVAAALAGPTVAKAFSPASITIGATTRLTITLANANGADITGVAFTDTYPTGLVNADPVDAATTCGGTISATAGDGSLSLSGGTIPAGGDCTVSADITATTIDSFINEIEAGAVTSDNAPANGAAAASAPLVVTAAAAAAAAIPTLGGWALLLLAGALGFITLRVIRS